MTVSVIDDSFGSGAPDIDRQHDNITNIIHDLKEAEKMGMGMLVIPPLMDVLKEYSTISFYQEEQYMLHLDYPKYSPHQEEHENFVSKLEEFEAAHEGEDQELASRVLEFLKAWVSIHLLEADAQLKRFLDEKINS